MSWMQKLYRTYEAVSSKSSDDDTPLTPIGHTQQTAHIVITINGNGDFLTASVMPAKTAIMLPATESSENRTSGEAPHSLADKLQYVAQDYPAFGGNKKAYFDGYVAQLKAWCDSPFAHPKVQAVLNYVKKGKVVSDLVQVGVLPVNAQGKVLSKWDESSEAPAIFSVLTKTKGEIEFGSALVCWRVEVAGDAQADTWTDSDIWQSWAEYLSSADSEQGFCLVKGEMLAIATMHPAKLRHTGDKAKLISSNDTAGYTYRGRFVLAEESASISADVSAKAHSALRWLIARQGIRNGEQVTVAWAVGRQEVPSPLLDYFSQIDVDDIDALDITADETPQDAKQNTQQDVQQNLSSNKDWSADFGRKASYFIKKKLHGYQARLAEHEQISLLMLDSATPGRMALTYYQEFLPSDYFANLDAWIDDFCWYQRHSIENPNVKKSDKKRTLWAVVPPSPFVIGQAVYGVSLSDNLKKQLYARLLPVIAGGQNVPIPYDLVQKSFQVACNPNGCENWEWQRNIGVACALYKGWRARHHDLSQRRIYDMNLDKENRSRDYLFGRLLAVAEALESKALQIADENRSTNAERYMQRFATRPLSTWLQIELGLDSYKNRLRNNRYMGFLKNREKEIDEIVFALNNLDGDKTWLDKPLDGEFLLGYHSQKMAYRTKSAQTDQTNQDNETE